jgi:hypothetical protein
MTMGLRETPEDKQIRKQFEAELKKLVDLLRCHADFQAYCAEQPDPPADEPAID